MSYVLSLNKQIDVKRRFTNIFLGYFLLATVFSLIVYFFCDYVRSMEPKVVMPQHSTLLPASKKH